MALRYNSSNKIPVPKPSVPGRFSKDAPLVEKLSATHGMIEKLERLFNIRKKISYVDGFERLREPLLFAQSPELRASFHKIMPEKIKSFSTVSKLHENTVTQLSNVNDNNAESDISEVSEVNSFNMEDIWQMKDTTTVAINKVSLDPRAAKSVIRLSNAILPLLKFYQGEVDIPKVKSPGSPSKGRGGRAHSTPKPAITTGVEAGTATEAETGERCSEETVNIQEVHHAFHAVLKHIRRLETRSTTTTVLPPPPPLPLPTLPPDIAMSEINAKVFDHIVSLEKQLHTVQDSKRHQYESMLEQLQTSERQNAVIKSKLEASQAAQEEYRLLAIDREKQLQTTIVYLSAAQDEIRNLKLHNARIPKQKREHHKELHQESLRQSKYSATQFIKMTAQVDALRAELTRQREVSHSANEALQERAEDAESRAQHYEQVAEKLQQQIAHSHYFQQAPTLAPTSGSVTAEGEHEVDDSHLYVDAPELQASASAAREQADHSGGSTISTVSSQHGSGSSANTGNAFLATGSDSHHRDGTFTEPLPAAATATETSKTTATGARKTGVPEPATAPRTPTRLKSTMQDNSPQQRRSKSRDKDQERAFASPTRASYERTKATVEQFVPEASATGTGQQGARNATFITQSAVGADREPWRPPSASPPPSHIRTGYYNFQHLAAAAATTGTKAGNQESYAAVNHSRQSNVLQEAGFTFHSNNQSRRSRSRSYQSPVRSIRPKKGTSALQNTEASRRRSVSLSPFRQQQTLSPTTLRIAHSSSASKGMDPRYVPTAVRGAHVNRDLNLGKCSYCTHNLLELWSRKFGPSAGKANTVSTATSTVEDNVLNNSSSDSSSDSCSSAESDTHLSTPQQKRSSKHKQKSKKDRKIRKGGSSLLEPGSAGKMPGSAVRDSAGNSVSYAIGWPKEPKDVVPSPAPAPSPQSKLQQGGEIDHSHRHPLNRSRESAGDELSAITENTHLERLTAASAEQPQHPSATSGRRTRSVSNGSGIAAAGVSPPPSTATAQPQRSQSPLLGTSTTAAAAVEVVPRHSRSPMHSSDFSSDGEALRSSSAWVPQVRVDSSNETLGSFPVNSANTATSQHTTQLLQKLRSRDIHPKAYLTTADTKQVSADTMLTQFNAFIRQYNEILMTLGNELLMSENMKSDYKQEIHESVNLVSELQTKVHMLQTENDSLYETITATQVERDKLSMRHEELVVSMQEELLQTRVENEDLQEEAESLKHQLLDALYQHNSNSSVHQQIKADSQTHAPASTHSPSPHSSPSQKTHSSPSHRRSRNDETEDKTQRKLDQKRIAELEQLLQDREQERSERVRELERQCELHRETETTLSQTKQKLLESSTQVQELQQQLQRAHSVEDAERKDHSKQNRTAKALEDALQKVAHAESLKEVQAQLLQQKEHQIQQLTDSQYLQTQLNQTLQTQLSDLRKRYSAASPLHSGSSNHPNDEAERLRQQLEAAFRELEEVKRQHGSAGLSGMPPPILMPSSPSSPSRHSQQSHSPIPPAHHPTEEDRRSIAGYGKPPTPVSVASHQQQLSLHPPLPQQYRSPLTHPHAPCLDSSSPTSASSVSSIRTGQSSYSLTSTQYASSQQYSQHQLQQQHNYQGDLQYISNLDAIPEEASSARTGQTSRTASVAAQSEHPTSVVHETQSFGESKHGDFGQQQRYQGPVGIASASVRSDRSGVSVTGEGTPIHSLFHTAYAAADAVGGQGRVAEEQRSLDETLHRQLTSLTATNTALTARATQLEQRLRHSELRCKLLMDQIKSMPVSLSVAQAEKRVIECKLEKATTTYELNLKKLTETTNKKIHELSAYLQMERADKAKCEKQVQEQRETIHQLTHHVRVLRTQLQVAQEQRQLGLDENWDGMDAEGAQGRTTAAAGTHFESSHYPHTPTVAPPRAVTRDTLGYFPQYQYPQQPSVPVYEDPVSYHPHTLRTVQQTHTSSGGGSSHHLSRTVPLTPLSVRKSAPERTTLSQTLPAHHSSGNRDSRSVPGLDAHIYGSHADTAHIIRASIPPAPWEDV